MKLRGIIASALAFALSVSLAFAQGNQGTSPLTIAKGGTNASTAAGARTQLGVVIGTNVQAWDADLDALAALSGTSTIYYRSGAGAWSAVTVGGMLSFVTGTLNVGDAELVALAGLTSAVDKIPYFTGSGTAALADYTALARTLDANSTAAGMRSTLGVVIGTNVQAWDADLDCIAANSTAGLMAYTGAGTCAYRTLTAPAAGFTITNPAGTAGNPTFVLANDLAALEALASTGFAVRTTTDTWAQRTLTAPAAGFTITNPAGVAGDPTFVLANDLAALEGLSSTGIARRTGTDAWSVGTAVSNAEHATMAANTVKANATGGSATPTDVTAATARSSSLLNVDSFTGHGDSIYTILTTDRTVGTNAAFTASRTWTLPAANAVNPGQEIVVADFQGTVTGSNTLVISRAGSDTVNGGTSVTITAANGAYLLKSDGTSKWTAQALGAAAAGGVSSVTCGTGLSGGVITTSGTCAVSLSTLTNSIGADVLLNNTANYFDGPVVAQGSSGTWVANGTITAMDTAIAAIYCKLWDGTTVISSAWATVAIAGAGVVISLSGAITSPTGNIRISCRDFSTANGKMMFNQTGNSKDSTITVFRIQ